MADEEEQDVTRRVAARALGAPFLYVCEECGSPFNWKDGDDVPQVFISDTNGDPQHAGKITCSLACAKRVAASMADDSPFIFPNVDP